MEKSPKIFNTPVIKTRVLFGLGIVMALFVALPLFVWSFVTQNFDIREKAAEVKYPTDICWNEVVEYNGRLSWPNGCKGKFITGTECTQSIVELSDTETEYYTAWIAAGRPLTSGCKTAKSPNPTATSKAKAAKNSPTPTATASATPSALPELIATPSPSPEAAAPTAPTESLTVSPIVYIAGTLILILLGAIFAISRISNRRTRVPYVGEVKPPLPENKMPLN